MKRHMLKSVLMVLLASVAGGWGPGGAAPAAGLKTQEGSGFEGFAKLAYSHELKAYVVEGDIVIHDIEALRAWFAPPASSPRPGRMLLIGTVDGRWDAWNDTQKLNLHYCVSKRFEERYEEIGRAMRKATADWERAANVKFKRVSQWDDDCRPRPEANSERSVFFSVEPADIRENAIAFFPRDPLDKRQIRVNWANAARSKTKTLTGIMRHELGHVLGFRHEHARPGSCLLTENGTSYEEVTGPDTRSVMLYTQCRDEPADYIISDLDREGASEVYGPSTLE